LFDHFDETAESFLGVLDFLTPEVQNQAAGFLERTIATFKQLQEATDPVYGEHRNQWMNNIRTQFQEWRDRRSNIPSSMGLAILLTGSLNPVSAAELREALEQGLKSLKDAETSIASRAKELEEQAIARAKRITDEARKTARGESMAAAQEQFEKAKDRAKTGALWFGIGGAGLTIALIVTAACMYKSAVAMAAEPSQPNGKGIDWASAISLLALKLVILSALAYVTSMCWRSFRAYLHMSELNSHRVHVANCIGAFAAAAQADETEDEVLIRMMESVVAFGNSGLLPHDDDTIAGQKIGFDPGSLVPRSATG
jgi:hypothetical protein